jgi:hypothetical protein
MSTQRWHEFLIESLCGMLTVTWWLFALAERSTLRGLRRLTQLADALSHEPDKGADSFGVVFDEANLSFVPRHGDTYAAWNELEPKRLYERERKFYGEV